VATERFVNVVTQHFLGGCMFIRVFSFTSYGSLAVLVTLYVSVTLMPTSAGAQVLEEVLVTSQRREQDLQSTPLSVAAFSGERLTELGVSDPQGLADFVPNLSMGDGTGRSSGGTQISIRGVNEARVSPVLDPAVGIYIDDVFFGRPQTSFLKLLDVERIEVLRGPQGTLFGKNSTGGAIRYITVSPSFDGFSGYAEAGLGDFGRTEVRAAVNAPFGDRVALRVSAASLQRDGYVLRLADGRRLGDEDTRAVQARLRFMPSDRLDITLSLDSTRRDTDDGPTKLIDYHNFNTTTDFTPGGPDSVGPGANSVAAWNAHWGQTPLRYGPDIPRSLYEVAGEGRMSRNRADSSGVRLDVGWSITDSLALRSITGVRDVEEFLMRDPDDQANAYSFFDDTFVEGTDFWSQELQFSGVGTRWNWVGGLYYSEDEPYRMYLESRDARSINNRGALIRNDSGHQTTKSTGLYFQAAIDLTERLTWTLGVRRTRDERLFRVSQTVVQDNELVALSASFGLPSIASGPINGCDPSVQVCVSVPELSGSHTYYATTPRVAFQYQFNNNVMGFVSGSRGFKAGGTNDTVGDIDTPFDPEYLWSYELGVRSTLAAGRARINATYFTMDYTNKQITVAASPFCNARCTHNVGTGEISGLELEAVGFVTEALQLSLAAATLDAGWKRITNPTAGVGINSAFSRAPELSYTLGGRYTAPLAGGGRIVASVDFAYTDKQNTSPQDSTTIIMPAYNLTNARVVYTPLRGNWNVAVFCSNCADKAYITGGAAWAGATDNTFFNYKPSTFVGYTENNLSLATAPPGISLVNVGAPRMLGVTFRLGF
jgi:iron complex outermembrane recepter protein